MSTHDMLPTPHFSPPPSPHPTQDLPPNTTIPPYVVEALVFAHLLDRMLASRPAKQADAPAWFDQAGMMAREYFVEAMRDAPKVCVPHPRRGKGEVY